ncbi:MAG TPA: 30S ribosomal protein S4 [Patescibacteria group bacterium]|nr:30S ribosomal protein S4 [Patescibacteria group bacterium]
MARITSPICRKCRREGVKLFLKGERCFSAKCAFVRRSYAPGMHGANSRSRNSQYASQLREKQKAKIVYGILEKQFRRYYEQMKRKGGTESMLSLIEKRIDNVIFRMGFAVSRRAARQMVLHGKFTVNGRKLSIPSAQLKLGDKVAVKGAEKNKDLSKNVKDNLKRTTPVSWIKVDVEALTGEITSLPKKEDIGEDINEKLIIEYYSR